MPLRSDPDSTRPAGCKANSQQRTAKQLPVSEHVAKVSKLSEHKLSEHNRQQPSKPTKHNRPVPISDRRDARGRPLRNQSDCKTLETHQRGKCEHYSAEADRFRTELAKASESLLKSQKAAVEASESLLKSQKATTEAEERVTFLRRKLNQQVQEAEEAQKWVEKAEEYGGYYLAEEAESTRRVGQSALAKRKRSRSSTPSTLPIASDKPKAADRERVQKEVFDKPKTNQSVPSSATPTPEGFHAVVIPVSLKEKVAALLKEEQEGKAEGKAEGKSGLKVKLKIPTYLQSTLPKKTVDM